MFDTPTKIKNFIQWCQANKVKSFKSGGVEFELSELAFIPQNDNLQEIKLDDEKTLADVNNLTREEYEELMFWSSGNPQG